jgi:hypothetical protein
LLNIILQAERPAGAQSPRLEYRISISRSATSAMRPERRSGKPCSRCDRRCADEPRHRVELVGGYDAGIAGVALAWTAIRTLRGGADIGESVRYLLVSRLLEAEHLLSCSKMTSTGMFFFVSRSTSACSLGRIAPSCATTFAAAAWSPSPCSWMSRPASDVTACDIFGRRCGTSVAASRVNAPVLEVVELDHVRDAMRIAGTPAHRTDDAGDVCYVVIKKVVSFNSFFSNSFVTR